MKLLYQLLGWFCIFITFNCFSAQAPQYSKKRPSYLPSLPRELSTELGRYSQIQHGDTSEAVNFFAIQNALQNPKLLKQPLVPIFNLRQRHFDKSGNYIYGLTSSGNFVLWDVKTGNIKKIKLLVPSVNVDVMTFPQDIDYDSQSNTIVLMPGPMDPNNIVKVFTGNNPVWQIPGLLSAQIIGPLLYGVTSSGIKIYNIRQKEIIREVSIPNFNPVTISPGGTKLAFSPRGPAASMYISDVLEIWDLITGAHINTLHNLQFLNVQWLDETYLFLHLEREKIIKLIDTRTSKLILEKTLLSKTEDYTVTLAVDQETQMRFVQVMVNPVENSLISIRDLYSTTPVFTIRLSGGYMVNPFIFNKGLTAFARLDGDNLYVHTIITKDMQAIIKNLRVEERLFLKAAYDALKNGQPFDFTSKDSEWKDIAAKMDPIFIQTILKIQTEGIKEPVINLD